MLLQDQFKKLMNEYPNVEKLIDEVTRIRAEMTIVKSNFNRLDAEEMEDALDKYDRLYNEIPDMVEKVDLYRYKIINLANKLDVEDFDGYDDKVHKVMVKAMRKQIKEAYKNQIEEVEYEEDIEADINVNEVDTKQSRKSILGQFNAIKRKIHK